MLKILLVVTVYLASGCSGLPQYERAKEHQVVAAMLAFIAHHYKISDATDIGFNCQTWRFQNNGVKTQSYMYSSAEALVRELEECEYWQADRLLESIGGAITHHNPALLDGLKNAGIRLFPQERTEYVLTLSEIVFDQERSSGLLYCAFAGQDWEEGFVVIVANDSGLWRVRQVLFDFIN